MYHLFHVDDLNKMRAKKGLPLRWPAGDGEWIEQKPPRKASRDVLRGKGTASTRKHRNPVGDYGMSSWQPHGSFPQYETVKELAKVVGYTLVETECDEGWLWLYFDADADRGGCPRRADFWGEELDQVLRSEVLDEGMVSPLTRATQKKGETLEALEAYRCGRLVLRFDSGPLALRWDSPLEADEEPALPVRYEEGKANFERVFVARR